MDRTKILLAIQDRRDRAQAHSTHIKRSTMTHNTTIETVRPERSNGHLVVVAARGGNAHQGAWLPGGVLVPACTKKATRTNWMLRNDLDVDCPRCVNILPNG